MFWRNYFFNCAYARYEAGLSIDEIWSEQSIPPPTEEGEKDETITFDSPDPKKEAAGKPAASQQKTEGSADAATGANAESAPAGEKELEKKSSGLFEGDAFKTPAATEETPGSSAGTSAEYEVVDDDFSGEMDELEAEIAQALEG